MKKVSFDYRCGNQRGITVSTEQVIRDLPEFTDQFQNAYSENGFYQPIPNNHWTCGFGPERSGWHTNIHRMSA